MQHWGPFRVQVKTIHGGNERKAVGGRAGAGRDSDLFISLWGSRHELNQHVHQSEQPHINLLQSAAEGEQLLAIRRSMRSINAEPIAAWSPAYGSPWFS